MREFKATFSTIICELEFKYGTNYIEGFTFKQLPHYVHCETLDVYEQLSLRILGVTQIPNPTYATSIATASQTTLQVAIAHHGIMPNSIPISLNLYPQQLIATIANIPPTINARAFVDQVGNSFEFSN